jgi:hypothetical protein
VKHAKVAGWGIDMELDELLDMQERGARDRIHGRTLKDNPMSRPELMPLADVAALQDWYAKYEAWRFGWSIEDADLRH